MTESRTLKPLSLWQSLLLTVIPAVGAYVALHFTVPAFIENTGRPFFYGYMIWWMTWMGLVFIVSFVAYYLEGNPLTWRAFAARYRLRRLNKRDWLWTFGLLAIHVLAILFLGAISQWLGSFAFLRMPASFPPELQPGGTSDLIPGVFMGMSLLGKWWIVILYFVGWVFNILGEEFWWRGYMLPRQELTHGRYTWIIHGILWAVNHLFQKWTLPILLLTALIYAYTVQKCKNTWITIIVHGLMNLTALVVITVGVAG